MDYKTVDNNIDCQSVDSGYDDETIWEPIDEDQNLGYQTTTSLSNKCHGIIWENTQNVHRSNQPKVVVDKTNNRLLFDVNSRYRHFQDDEVRQSVVKAKLNCHQTQLAYLPPSTLIKVATMNYDVGPLGIVSKLWNLNDFSLSTYNVSKRLPAIMEIHIYLKEVVALEKNERNVLTDVQPLDVFEKGYHTSQLFNLMNILASTKSSNL